MTQVAELMRTVRRDLKDPVRAVVDSKVYAAAMGKGPFNLGKQLAIQTYSDVLTINSVQQVRGVDYRMDYEANQMFLLAAAPTVGQELRLGYNMSVWRDEEILTKLNDGRRMLFMRHYRRRTASFVTSGTVRDYNLRTAAVEPWAQQLFRLDSSNYVILNATTLPNGNVNQTVIPFRRFHDNGDGSIHLWRILPSSWTVYLELAYAFSPFVQPTDEIDVPDQFQGLVCRWATRMLLLAREPERARQDSANVQQGPFANAPQTLSGTSDDFVRAWLAERDSIKSTPLMIDWRDEPKPFEINLRKYR